MKLNITLHLVIKLIYLGKVKYRIEKSSFLEIYEDLNYIRKIKNLIMYMLRIMKLRMMWKKSSML